MAILSVAVLLADLWALYELLKSNEGPVVKVLWAALIIILPLVGVILWYLLGPKSESLPASA